MYRNGIEKHSYLVHRRDRRLAGLRSPGSVAARGTRSRFSFEVGTAMKRRSNGADGAAGCGGVERRWRAGPDLASSSRHAESAIDGGQARPRLLQPSRGITPPWRKQTVMRLRRRGSGLEWRRGAATLESGGLVEGRDGAARHGATVDGG
ncbi:hypothetical protein OsI_29758 [Oryza sativa Indica Group]|uniref:Uncharacterized protein n=1 Tax=Oryza sativa subsp. indica TaxID=39946 RepID=B8BC44_ORYSI|nr:hypothetical protein OsI_29758 [Oryza sativa Indica Group]